MTGGFASPDERLEKPIDTDMPHSTSDVRELASVVRDLADAIDDAIDLASGAYEDTQDGGWDDDGADRFRASLMVGRTNASELEADVRTYARKLDEYANVLSAADERLERAREIASQVDLLDGTVIHPPEVGVYIGERMMAPDQREPGYDQRQATEDAYYTARAEFDAAVDALSVPDGIPQFAKDAVKQTYFSTNSFILAEIDEVAKWYNQGNVRPQLLSDLPTGSRPPYNLLPEVPDDLVLRSLKSYGGSVINVFGIAFDIYTGTSVPEAIFVGTTGALAGFLAAQGLQRIGGAAALTFVGLASWTPPGWAVILISGGAAWLATAQATEYWDNLPEPVRDWMEAQRQLSEKREDGREWREAYNDQNPGRGINLEGP